MRASARPATHIVGSMRAKLSLYDAGLGLIIEHPTGVIYSNQTGGNFCLQPELEGAFVPLDAPAVEDQLYAWFTQGDGHPIRLPMSDADRVDEILRDAHLAPTIVVDRERLAESSEAWIYVLLQETEFSVFSGFGPYPRRGVLTWANSD